MRHWGSAWHCLPSSRQRPVPPEAACFWFAFTPGCSPARVSAKCRPPQIAQVSAERLYSWQLLSVSRCGWQLARALGERCTQDEGACLLSRSRARHVVAAREPSPFIREPRPDRGASVLPAGLGISPLMAQRPSSVFSRVIFTFLFSSHRSLKWAELCCQRLCHSQKQARLSFRNPS